MGDGRKEGWVILREEERSEEVQSAEEDEEQGGFEGRGFEGRREMMSNE